MNSKLVFLLATGGAAFLFAADQPRKDPNEFDKLKAKVSLLEGRVSQLESRLLSLSQTPRTSFEPSTPEKGRDPLIPPNIGMREVNGLKVYAVPLAAPGKVAP